MVGTGAPSIEADRRALGGGSCEWSRDAAGRCGIWRRISGASCVTGNMEAEAREMHNAETDEIPAAWWLENACQDWRPVSALSLAGLQLLTWRRGPPDTGPEDAAALHASLADGEAAVAREWSDFNRQMENPWIEPWHVVLDQGPWERQAGAFVRLAEHRACRGDLAAAERALQDAVHTMRHMPDDPMVGKPGSAERISEIAVFTVSASPPPCGRSNDR